MNQFDTTDANLILSHFDNIIYSRQRNRVQSIKGSNIQPSLLGRLSDTEKSKNYESSCK